MSLGATISAPAKASDTAVLTRSSTLSIILDLIMFSVAGDDAAMSVRCVFAQTHVRDLDEGIESAV